MRSRLRLAWDEVLLSTLKRPDSWIRDAGPYLTETPFCVGALLQYKLYKVYKLKLCSPITKEQQFLTFLYGPNEEAFKFSRWIR